MSNILTDIGTRVGQELKADRLRIAALEGKDPVITLAGDATGSVTLTSLGSGTLNVTVVDDSHNHVIDNVDGLQLALDGKAPTNHAHAIADVTGLQTALDGKSAIDDAATSTAKTWSSSKVSTELSGKANTSHTHTLSQITDFPVAVSATELGYLDGVTSAIQTQLNSKQATITGAATTITTSNLTASMAMVTDSSGKVSNHATVSATELGYLDGVTSAIQTQINGKESTITTLTVAKGGTGATALTGILKGNGTGAFSAAVSGTDIKTINGNSLLGSGNVSISSGLQNNDASDWSGIQMIYNTTTITAPANAKRIMVYCFGAGGNGSTTHSGGGGGFALYEGSITSSAQVAISVDTVSSAVYLDGGATLLARATAAVLNSAGSGTNGFYLASGGAGQTYYGGSSSGSILGNGKISYYSGGAGWGSGNLGGLGGGGIGGGAYTVNSSEGSTLTHAGGRGLPSSAVIVDPLLLYFSPFGGNTTGGSGASGSGGAGAPYANSAPGSSAFACNGGFGGGGGSHSAPNNSTYCGNGGFGGGGGGSQYGQAGNGGVGGGGGRSSNGFPGTGGSGCVVIFWRAY